MNASKLLRIGAIICFALAAIGVMAPVIALVPLGLGLWVLASFF